jgi:hypothetical protein
LQKQADLPAFWRARLLDAGDVEAEAMALGIPTKPNTHSGMIPNGIPG